jgi:hypothetical protein
MHTNDDSRHTTHEALAPGVWQRTAAFAVALAVGLGPACALAFDLTNASIPVDEIRAGGPPKDGIPSIDAPRFVAPAAAEFLRADDFVAGISLDGFSRAYPLRILVWHEAVNDVVGGRAILVTYCPLTGSVVTFDRRVGNETLEFGISGLLYQSNVLLYDRRHESLWSQLASRAVSGPLAGRTLAQIPSEVTTWSDWKSRHPDGVVLSLETGHQRNYATTPYRSYESSPETMFPVIPEDDRLAPKTWVVGVRFGDMVRAYPLASLPAGRPHHDRIGDHPIEIVADPGTRRVVVRRLDGVAGPDSVVAYWFAWAASHPGTEIHEAKQPRPGATAPAAARPPAD